MVNKGAARLTRGLSESKQQAVLRAACCVFGARCNIVRDVVFDTLLSRPCAWLHILIVVADLPSKVFCRLMHYVNEILSDENTDTFPRF